MISFFIILLALGSIGARAQEFHTFAGDFPFDTSLEVEAMRSSSVTQTLTSGSHQFKRVKNSKFGVSGRFLELKNSSSQIHNYASASLGLNYKHYLEENRVLGFMGTFGSASNKLFRDGRDSTIMANVIYRYDEKWMWLGNYSNNRTFLNNVPLPGLLYIKENTRERTMMFGFPFIYINQPLSFSELSYKYIGILPYNHRLRLLYNGMTMFKPFFSYEQGPQVFFDTNRTINNLRTFWFERRVGVGLEKSFGPFLKIDFFSGQSFDRQYFDSRSYMRTHRNVRTLQDSFFVSLNLKSSF
jgi:hypothetical protein